MTRSEVLIVEDDFYLVELLTWHFQREGFSVRTTPNGEEAMLLVAELVPDVVILDWMLEGVPGIEVCWRLRRNPGSANVPIIMVTARGEESDRLRGFETGADDYLTKPFSPRELVARTYAVLRRVRPAMVGIILAYEDLEMDVTNVKVKRGGQTVSLGPTEFRLLRHFMEHPRRVFSRDRLLDTVWGHNKDVDPRTVDVHIRRLRSALNSGGKPDLIRTVRSSGYALDNED